MLYAAPTGVILNGAKRNEESPWFCKSFGEVLLQKISLMYYVYIMANKNNNVLYTGVTNNLVRRVYEHKNKLVKGFTQKYNVDKLVYFDSVNDVKAAIMREKQIKGWTRKKKDDLVSGFNSIWEDLYERICE